MRPADLRKAARTRTPASSKGRAEVEARGPAATRRPVYPSSGLLDNPANVLALQQMAGNQAVQRLLRATARESGHSPGSVERSTAPVHAAVASPPAMVEADDSEQREMATRPESASASNLLASPDDEGDSPGESSTPSVQERASSSVVQREGTSLVLDRVAGWAREIPGYDLLTVILGRDPISDAPVERNATNLVRGVLSLVPGGDQIYQNLQESRALEQAFQWLQQEVATLGLTWNEIKGLFQRAWDALSWTDLLDPSGAWEKLRGIFDPALGRIRQFARDAGQKVLEFVFEGALRLGGPLAARVLEAIRRAGDAFSTIIRDPIGFAGNLIQAVRNGFTQFLANIETHLKQGLIGWLFGALGAAGIEIPATFDLKGILAMVLQILGLTWQNLRQKLIGALGEPTVSVLEKSVDLVKTLATEGLAGAWRQLIAWVSEEAGNLKDLVLGAIKDWVVTSVVKAAVTKLLTMFNPAGAIIQAILSIYNTMQFFIERANQILDVVNAVLDSLGSIAAGDLKGAANFIEQTLARSIPVVISFLANLLGLGGIGEKIRETIEKVRMPIDKALNKLVGWVATKARAGLDWLTRKGQQAAGFVKGKLGLGESETTQSAAVKARAHQELAARTAQPLGSVAQLQSVMAEVLERLRPEGLKELRMAPKPDAPGRFVIFAAASPETPVDEVEVGSPEQARQIAEFVAVARTQLARAQEYYQTTLRAGEGAEKTVAFANGQPFVSGGASVKRGQESPEQASRTLLTQAILWESGSWVKDAAAGLKMSTLDLANELAAAEEERRRDRSSTRYADLMARIQKVVGYVPTRKYARDYQRYGLGIPAQTSAGPAPAVEQPGLEVATHAEKHAAMLLGDVPIGVSREMCADCQAWFVDLARRRNRFQVVADPRVVRIFSPDGQIRDPAGQPVR